MISAPELVLDAQADLGEGPSWDARAGRLYWVDIHAGRLHIFNPKDGSDHPIEVGEYLGCVAPRHSGGLILALRTGFALLDSLPPLTGGEEGSKTGILSGEAFLASSMENDSKMGILSSRAAQNPHFADLNPPSLPAVGGEKGGRGDERGNPSICENMGVLPPAMGVRVLISPEPHLSSNRFNDGKCDPAGRFLAGSMDDAEVEATGSLYSLSPDGSVKILLTGLRISNGLAWSPDAHTFYHIDTPTRAVMAYDYDIATGAIATPRPAISVPPELGWPDGMTSDSAGMLWVAMWGGARLTRWDPATGRLLADIPFPALNVSSCCFGGPTLTDLYVTSARKGMTGAQLTQYPLSGSLFRLRTSIPGMPTFEFGG